MWQSDNVATKKLWYFKGREAESSCCKGCFGYVAGFHGMTETQQRGALHFHVLLYGSLTPKLLELAAGSPNLEKVVADALDTMYCAKIPQAFHIQDYMGKGMKKNYLKSAKENCKFPKFPPKATQSPPLPCDANREDWNNFFHEAISFAPLR